MTTLPTTYEPLLLTLHKPRVVDGKTLIGDDYGTQLEVISGAVYSVDPDGLLPRRFVNSSIEAFASCIEAHRALHSDSTSRSSAPEDDELRIVESFASNLTNIDRSALADPENWWSVILEQTLGY